MAQSKMASGLEASANTLSGYFISLALWLYVAGPMFGYEVNVEKGIGLTLLFTVTSLIRSYVWRRWFTKSINQWLNDTFPGTDDADV
jgi:hypothetical protein